MSSTRRTEVTGEKQVGDAFGSRRTGNRPKQPLRALSSHERHNRIRAPPRNHGDGESSQPVETKEKERFFAAPQSRAL